MSFINKIITTVLVPIFMSQFLPFVHIAKLVYPEKDLISVTENGVSNEEDPIFFTAHRGVTAVAPENSIPSYEAAVENGYYSAECDIRLTSDNQWVLIHNSDVNGRFCQMAKLQILLLKKLGHSHTKTVQISGSIRTLKSPHLMSSLMFL